MKIGFIGLGIMGEAMCTNIIRRHDDDVYVYDVIEEKTQALAAAGGIPCRDALELAEKSDVIITMVPKSDHSRAVYGEILPSLHDGMLCIDMSTIDPDVSVEISRTVKETGCGFIDAPVVKSRPAAEAGKLGIYTGGSEEDCRKAEPVLKYMGENIIRMGDNGRGLVMKICHNALVSQIQNGVNETAGLAGKYGIDILTFAEAISYGGGQNFYLDSKKQAIHDRNFTPAFTVANMHKDVHICLNMAESAGLSMPGERNAAAVYDRAMEEGLGREDFCATYKAVNE